MAAVAAALVVAAAAVAILGATRHHPTALATQFAGTAQVIDTVTTQTRHAFSWLRKEEYCWDDGRNMYFNELYCGCCSR